MESPVIEDALVAPQIENSTEEMQEVGETGNEEDATNEESKPEMSHKAHQKPKKGLNTGKKNNQQKVIKKEEPKPLPALTLEEEANILADFKIISENAEACKKLSILVRELVATVYAIEKKKTNKFVKHITNQKRSRDNDPYATVVATDVDSQKTAGKHLRKIIRALASFSLKGDSNEGLLVLLLKQESNSFMCTVIRAILENHKHITCKETNVPATPHGEIVTKLRDNGITLMSSVEEDMKDIIQMTLYNCSKMKSNEDIKLQLRPLAVIADHGNDEQRDTVLSIIQKVFKRLLKKQGIADEPKAQHEFFVQLLLDNVYISNVIAQLLEQKNNKTREWVDEFLLASTTPITVKELFHLIENINSSSTIAKWINTTNREYILRNVFNKSKHFRYLLSTGRGTNFLTRLLEIDTLNKSENEERFKNQSELSNKILELILSQDTINEEATIEEGTNPPKPLKKLDVVATAMSQGGNYVIQNAFQHLPLCAAFFPQEAKSHLKNILEILDNYTPPVPTTPKVKKELTEKQKQRKEKGFLRHVGGYHQNPTEKASELGLETVTAYQLLSLSSVGCHSLIALINAIVSSNGILDISSIVTRILNPVAIPALMADQYGGLVVRTLVSKISKNDPESLLIFKKCASEQFDKLAFGEFGNLVIQQLIKIASPSDLKEFYNEYISERVSKMVIHKYAVHVLTAFFERDDNTKPEEIQTIVNDMINKIKENTITLVKDINGRFLITKAIPFSAEIRSALMENFVDVAKSKGTQITLVTLWEFLSGDELRRFIDNQIILHARELATDITGSMTFQRFIQISQVTDKTISPEKASLCHLAYEKMVADEEMKKELIKDFYARFVLRLLMSSAQPKKEE